MSTSHHTPADETRTASDQSGDNADELGDIEVSVTVREPDVASMIGRVAPPTEDGAPVDPESKAE